MFEKSAKHQFWELIKKLKKPLDNDDIYRIIIGVSSIQPLQERKKMSDLDWEIEQVDLALDYLAAGSDYEEVEAAESWWRLLKQKEELARQINQLEESL